MVLPSSSDKDFKLNQVYTQLDRKFEEEETQRKAEKNKVPYMNLTGFPVDVTALAVIPKQTASDLGVVPFFKEGHVMKWGMLSPSKAIDDLALVKREDSTIQLYQISKSSFKSFLEGYNKVVEIKHRSDDIRISGEEINVSGVNSLSDLGEQLKQVTITQLIDTVMKSALGLGSSDVHWEPEPTGMHIRFRIDGVLQDITTMPKESIQQILSRIKVLAKLKLNVTDMPQDGSFALHYNKSEVDVRVSVLPSAFGESVVMRLLRQDQMTFNFDELGITGIARERIEDQIHKPHGMILTTGPTGSGKTTTIYAILNLLNHAGVKIMTLEDPIEYKIAGITQTPVSNESGLTYAGGLRAILRQDPDIVMVGEMRDLETAETAAQAALTGHKVLTTLHTNDASSALPRLLDLGIKPFILAPAINSIMAQRLLRKICQFCKQEHVPDKKVMERIDSIVKSIPESAHIKIPRELKFYHSMGCPKCSGLGYKGRIGIFEIFNMNEAIEKLINKAASTSEIRAQAIKDGMLTMAQDGLIKALAGVTDVEEVFRVTEE